MRAFNVNYARSQTCGRHAPESEPEGIDCLVGGKPHYTGKEDQWSSSRFSSRRS